MPDAMPDARTDPRSAYAERLEARRRAVAGYDRKHRTIGNLRLVVFVADSHTGKVQAVAEAPVAR